MTDAAAAIATHRGRREMFYEQATSSLRGAKQCGCAVRRSGLSPSLLRHPQFGRPHHRVASPMDPSATASIHPSIPIPLSIEFSKDESLCPSIHSIPLARGLFRGCQITSRASERARVSEVGLSLFLCVGRDRRRRRFRGMPDMVSERGVDCACPRDEADDARVIRAATSASPLPPPPAARVVGQWVSTHPDKQDKIAVLALSGGFGQQLLIVFQTRPSSSPDRRTVPDSPGTASPSGATSIPTRAPPTCGTTRPPSTARGDSWVSVSSSPRRLEHSMFKSKATSDIRLASFQETRRI